MDEYKGLNFYDVGMDTIIATNEKEALECAKASIGRDFDESDNPVIVDRNEWDKRFFYDTESDNMDEVDEKDKVTFKEAIDLLINQCNTTFPRYFCTDTSAM